ncbi:hypothetical protein BVRB_032030, partial [Beta vulgaris subsp. vulgaris]
NLEIGGFMRCDTASIACCDRVQHDPIQKRGRTCPLPTDPARMTQSDDEIDLSVLEDDPDDRVIRRKRTSPKPDSRNADPHDEFDLFLSRNRERQEQKARIESMLNESLQVEQTTQRELERIREEIAREEIVTSYSPTRCSNH